MDSSDSNMNKSKNEDHKRISSPLSTAIDEKELKAIKIAIRRSNVSSLPDTGLLNRTLDDPTSLRVHLSGVNGRPVFYREDVRLNLHELTEEQYGRKLPDNVEPRPGVSNQFQEKDTHHRSRHDYSKSHSYIREYKCRCLRSCSPCKKHEYEKEKRNYRDLSPRCHEYRKNSTGCSCLFKTYKRTYRCSSTEEYHRRCSRCGSPGCKREKSKSGYLRSPDTRERNLRSFSPLSRYQAQPVYQGQHGFQASSSRFPHEFNQPDVHRPIGIVYLPYPILSAERFQPMQEPSTTDNNSDLERKMPTNEETGDASK